MNNHYYSSKPSVESNEKKWTFTLRGRELAFLSDRGVFSKNEVDFGSRLLIETFELPEVEGDLLDVGCGYGPIGLALATLDSSRTVEMVDVNERAIELSKKNAEKNGIANIKVYESFVYDSVEKKTFAAILSNPPIRAGKEVVHSVLEGAFDRLVSGGELWIVIQKKQGAPSALKKLEELFGDVEVVEKKKGYYIIKSKKS